MEQVRHTRKNLLFYLDIIDLDTNDMLGNLGDISENGLMIIAEKPFSYNRFKNISIQLPEDFEEFPQKTFDVEVEIRWMKADQNPHLQRLGCKFVKQKADDIQLIKKLQDFLGFND